MSLRLGGDFDLELFLTEQEKRTKERDERLFRYLTRPNAEIRQLFASSEAKAAPIVLDLGAPSGGLLWSVQQVLAGPGQAVAASNVSPSNNYGTVTAPGANAVIVGVGQIGTGANFPAGLYQLTAYAWYGATAETVALNNMKVVASGLTTIRQLYVPPAVNGAPVAQSMQFNLTAPATFQIQAIAAASAGAIYNAALDVAPILGFGAQSVNAGVFVGGVPTDITHAMDTASLSATGLSVPFNYQAGGKSLVARQGQHVYVVLQGAGTTAGQWTASATVLEVPDTKEALLWL